MLKEFLGAGVALAHALPHALIERQLSAILRSENGSSERFLKVIELHAADDAIGQMVNRAIRHVHHIHDRHAGLVIFNAVALSFDPETSARYPHAAKILARDLDIEIFRQAVSTVLGFRDPVHTERVRALQERVSPEWQDAIAAIERGHPQIASPFKAMKHHL